MAWSACNALEKMCAEAQALSTQVSQLTSDLNKYDVLVNDLRAKKLDLSGHLLRLEDEKDKLIENL